MDVYVTWEDIDRYMDLLVERLKPWHNDSCGIYAPPRGGLVLGVMLSHRLCLPMLSHAIDRCIFIDDIVDTGDTLLCATNSRCIYSMSIYYHKHSKKEPNFWIKEKTEDWIVFPWENKKRRY